MLTSVSVTKHSARPLRVAQLKTLLLRVINNVKLEEKKMALLGIRSMLGRQEADLKVYSLAACFYDDLGYFGRGLCLFAIKATT